MPPQPRQILPLRQMALAAEEPGGLKQPQSSGKSNERRGEEDRTIIFIRSIPLEVRKSTIEHVVRRVESRALVQLQDEKDSSSEAKDERAALMEEYNNIVQSRKLLLSVREPRGRKMRGRRREPTQTVRPCTGLWDGRVSFYSRRCFCREGPVLQGQLGLVQARRQGPGQ